MFRVCRKGRPGGRRPEPKGKTCLRPLLRGAGLGYNGWMDHVERIPALIAAACLTIYWGAVVVKLVKLARKIGKDPNAMPRERVGQLMRVLWYPTVVVMLAGAWINGAGAERAVGRKLGMTEWLARQVPPSGFWWAAAAAATAVCVLGTVYTFVCWRKMGRSWRIGIDPHEKLEMVSSGPYKFVRHPIYAIRMIINLCAWVMIPTALFGLMAMIDIVLMQIEARREEKYMETTHGRAYSDYKKNVGRFVPRMPPV